MEETERKPIFLNTYVPNEQTGRQIYRNVRFVRRLLVFLLGTGFLAVVLYYLVWLIRWAADYDQPVYTQRLFWLCIVAVALYAVLIVREIFAPRTFAKREIRRLKEAYGTDRVEIRAAFFDDGVAFHNLASNAEMQIAYTAFGTITETEDLFLAQTKQKQLITFSKLGFENTDIPGFRDFMDEKCPNAKRKWRKAD
ncbi:MAG: hypothetical protein II412_05510 [Clostridia bacterium]|nr:hypothetical protein [Clostridia bacterium]